MPGVSAHNPDNIRKIAGMFPRYSDEVQLNAGYAREFA